MWWIKFFAICFALAVFGCKPSSSLDVCTPFNSTLEQLCGYGTTVKFLHQSHFDNAFKTVKSLIKSFSSCSSYANLMICSAYIPRCVSNIDGPYLPCRRVCDEFNDKCGDHIQNYGQEVIIGMCQLLPKTDNPYGNYLDRCFEPPGFKNNLPDDGSSDPLKCYPLTVEKCQNIGYNYTIVSTERQNSYQRLIDPVLDQETNDSVHCALPRKRLICTDSFPACMNETLAMYCRTNCEDFFNKKCTPPFNYQKDICMEFPKGNSAVGICKRTQWTRVENWYAARQVHSTASRPVGPSSKLSISDHQSTTSAPTSTSNTLDLGKNGKAFSSASLTLPRWNFGLGVGTMVILTFRSLVRIV